MTLLSLSVLLICSGLGSALTDDDFTIFEYAKYWSKNYNGEKEFEGAQTAFKHNTDLAAEFNSQNKGFQLSVNGPFADMSWNYFKDTILMEPQDCSATKPSPKSLLQVTQDFPELPESFDWRNIPGVISEVKNQGSCGSCWTFSTTGALEAHHAIKYGSWKTPRLSEQQLVDCAQNFNNNGCDGGLPSHAFEYIHHSGGLSEEFFYPYEASTKKCRFNPNLRARVGVQTISSFNITQGNEDDILLYLYNVGPVSVAFQVVEGFSLYKSGVYSSDICLQGAQDVNHAVLVVGYGNARIEGETVPYWTVKNSWGKYWGEDGYFKIRRGVNMCGVATCSSFPMLEKEEPIVGKKLLREAV